MVYFAIFMLKTADAVISRFYDDMEIFHKRCKRFWFREKLSNFFRRRVTLLCIEVCIKNGIKVLGFTIEFNVCQNLKFFGGVLPRR